MALRSPSIQALRTLFGENAKQAKELLTSSREQLLRTPVGDTYTPTLVRFNGAYRIACWGDIAERHTTAA